MSDVANERDSLIKHEHRGPSAWQSLEMSGETHRDNAGKAIEFPWPGKPQGDVAQQVLHNTQLI